MKSARLVIPHAHPGMIYEVLVSTYYPKKGGNVAPMGIVFQDDALTSFIIRPFTDTATFWNLSETREGVVNVTRDPKSFLRTIIYGDVGELDEARCVGAPRLRGMEAYVEFRVREIRVEGSRGFFLCDVVEAYPGKPRIEPYNRAAYALIEAAVIFTKLKPFLEQGLPIDGLMKDLERCRWVVERTAEDTWMEEAIRILLERAGKLLRRDSSSPPSP